MCKHDSIYVGASWKRLTIGTHSAPVSDPLGAGPSMRPKGPTGAWVRIAHRHAPGRSQRRARKEGCAPSRGNRHGQPVG